MKRIHFIAIGGSAMHNLAIALHLKGFRITGSDDEIFEPSKSRLESHGLLPQLEGWNPGNITKEIDAIILGMHARVDNPELREAKNIGLRIYSYPEFLYEQTKHKIRVVIGGSHGKTTITSMIMHVLKENNIKFDFMVGAKIEGFDTMVGLSEDSKIAIFEGDEYLSSPIDRRPKFHLYYPHIALLTGIAWDHINVFPTYKNYVEQFSKFIDLIEAEGTLFYFKDDDELQQIVLGKEKINCIPYSTHNSIIEDGKTYLKNNKEKIELQIFGDHNLQNISGAKIVCTQLGISDENFYNAIKTFKGAARRLEVLAENEATIVFQDFAHSPSKLKATTTAVKNQYTDRKLIACMELHTFSSLKKEFLPQYKNCMNDADVAFVYYSPHTIEHKKLEAISKDEVKEAFNKEGLTVHINSDDLFKKLTEMDWINANLLLMSSGTFDGKNLIDFAKQITD